MKLPLSWANLPTYMALMLLIFNRAGSKISIGPVYFLDILIFIALYKKPKEIFRLSKIMFCGLGMSWLVYEIMVGELDILNFRRFAVALYMIVGIIITIYGRKIADILSRNIYISFLAILIAYGLSVPNFQPSIASQMMSLLLIAILFCSKTLYVRRSLPGVLFVSAVYLVVVFGLKGDGLYKTPLLGLFIALVAIVFFRYFSFLVGLKKIQSSFNLLVLLSLVIFVMSVTLIPSVQSVTAEAFYAISGLTGFNEFSNIASGLADQQTRGRGSSTATAETRVMFWSGIVAHSKTSFSYFMIGNGHYISFFDKIFINSGFIRSDLLEPHNSFLGIFYRYGIVGVVLFVAFMFQTRRYLAKLYVPNKDILIGCTIISVNYAMFEVALESPHGAILFWFIWLFPYLVGSEKGLSYSNSR